MLWLISIRRLAVFLAPLSLLILSGCQSSNSFDAPRANTSPERVQFTPEARLRVADKLRAAGDYMSALRMYQDVIDNDPKNLEARASQAELYLELGAPQQAAALYQSAVAVLPGEPRLEAGLGRVLTELGQGEAAIPHFERAMAKGERSAKTHNHYGVALDLAGRHRDAQVQYGMALDNGNSDLAAMNNLALSLALSEDYPAAVRLLSDLVTAAPNAVVARRNLALIYALSGDMNASQTMIRFPDNPAAEQSTQAYIKRMLQVPKELRAKAIFAGLESVADQMPAPDVSQQPQAEAAQVDPTKSLTPAVVNVTTGPAESQELPQESPQPSSSPATPEGIASEDDQAVAARTYFVQLGAYPSQQLAASGWQKMLAQSPTLLDGRTPAYYPFDNLVRLGLPASDRQAARDLCAVLKEGGLDCLIRWTADQNTP